MEQISRIERRQQRLRRLRARFQTSTSLKPTLENSSLEAAHTPETRYQIGKSQNEYDLIGTFLSKHSGDPAIQVKIPLHYLLCHRFGFHISFVGLSAPIERASASTHKGHNAEENSRSTGLRLRESYLY